MINRINIFNLNLKMKKIEKILKNFKKILPNDLIKTTDLTQFNTDYMKKYHGESPIVLFPRTTEQISKILQICNQEQIAVVPQSGNTGLVGGSVPLSNEIIISLRKMNKIIEINTIFDYVHCEAGCILQSLNDSVSVYNKEIPLDLASKGSCLIGGNLSTNAGGIHFIENGPLRNNCLEITAVLPSGEIVKLNESLMNMFIGAEGTLGIISECKVKIKEKNSFKTLLMLSFENWENIVKFMKFVNEMFQKKVTAIEFFDKNCLDVLKLIFDVEKTLKDIKNFCCLFEISNITQETLLENFSEKLIQYYEEIEGNSENSSIFSTSERTFNDLWSYREKISEAISKKGLVFKYDFSLNYDNYFKMKEVVEQRLKNKNVSVLTYGHVGDNNLHLNISLDSFEKNENFFEIQNLLEPFLYNLIKEVNGSISAEHGIGQAKSQYLNCSQSEENIILMKKLKKAIDPKNIMNPYKIFHNNI